MAKQKLVSIGYFESKTQNETPEYRYVLEYTNTEDYVTKNTNIRLPPIHPQIW